ncbi:Cu(I)-responsive transcriptional regulator [Kingella negevensis]|uniref:HTH-type transcriptional regulator CueR n=1 Tax=Kingella negevensis TaxID=1522312 RepID=A0A238HEC2_9NEIS|nr:Cu(I)-responsive transcriptional regulator [Kingella negevensis]MDK4680280.1 Cu(I)-responsive transcriptional regulator [Kingella negevensis]MDK4682000.1 Cu(I)-responsive transcriptional regulator [Kingella negevensis]MDK4688643.1 Cu(I)-responsive transcriptional regulator [Kingella negevensis]MDK4690196.1 Cu(I)-responsive transcriptional regulator [Kingella negevensis]MDK4692459.1 Cu(I)-responsive transcriptional regulator [Kingella negevensis]
MNISQAAAQTGLSAKQIRDYEKQGLLPETRRSESGYRVYSEQDLQRLRFIRHARDVGFSLAQIRELLALQDNPNRHSRDVKQLTAAHIADLTLKIEMLQNMREKLQMWHDQCAGDEHSACCILDGLVDL